MDLELKTADSERKLSHKERTVASASIAAGRRRSLHADREFRKRGRKRQ